jgi:hypothetical protein
MKVLFDTNQSKTVLANFKHKIDRLVPADDFEKQ